MKQISIALPAAVSNNANSQTKLLKHINQMIKYGKCVSDRDMSCFAVGARLTDTHVSLYCFDFYLVEAVELMEELSATCFFEFDEKPVVSDVSYTEEEARKFIGHSIFGLSHEYSIERLNSIVAYLSVEERRDVLNRLRPNQPIGEYELGISTITNYVKSNKCELGLSCATDHEFMQYCKLPLFVDGGKVQTHTVITFIKSELERVKTLPEAQCTISKAEFDAYSPGRFESIAETLKELKKVCKAGDKLYSIHSHVNINADKLLISKYVLKGQGTKRYAPLTVDGKPALKLIDLFGRMAEILNIEGPQHYSVLLVSKDSDSRLFKNLVFRHNRGELDFGSLVNNGSLATLEISDDQIFVHYSRPEETPFDKMYNIDELIEFVRSNAAYGATPQVLTRMFFMQFDFSKIPDVFMFHFNLMSSVVSYINSRGITVNDIERVQNFIAK